MFTACQKFTAAAVYFVALIIFATSFDTLTPLELGLKFNTLSKNIDLDAVYENGRYLLGVGQSFKRFPATLQTVEFSHSAARDEPPLTVVIESSTVQLSCAFQYRLVPGRIGGETGLYRKYSQGYHQLFVRTAKAAILASVNGTTVEDFYNSRPTIRSSIHSKIRSRFVAEGGYVTIPSFQLLYVEIPASKEKLIVQTEVKKEEQNTEAKKRAKKLIDAESGVVLNAATVQVKQLKDTLVAQADVIKNTAVAKAKEVTIDMEQSIFATYKKELGLSNTELLRFLWLKAQTVLSGNETNRVVAGLPNAVARLQ